MKAIYQCLGCNKVFKNAPTAAVQCNNCGSLYLRWVNFEEWRRAKGDLRH